MPTRSMEEIMDDLGPLLDEFDQIARSSHTRYRSYKSEDLVELDSRAQAACTYAHMAAAADRAFLGKDEVRPIELRGLKLWMFEKSNVVIRLKKRTRTGGPEIIRPNRQNILTPDLICPTYPCLLSG